MSSIFLPQDITDPEDENGSVSNDYLTFVNPYKYIISGEYSIEGAAAFNTSLDTLGTLQISMQGNYSEILDRLASSLDSPSTFPQDYSPSADHHHSSYLNHHSESAARSNYVHKQILMSSSSETLYETPKDNAIELNSDKSLIMCHETHPIIKDFASAFQDTNHKSKYVCPMEGCGKVFTRKANRRAHIETHNPNRARPFSCPKCSKSYLRSIDLIRHIDTTHEKTQKHFCNHCSRTFTRKEGLKKHQERGICSFSNIAIQE